jgi:hypothetical protein
MGGTADETTSEDPVPQSKRHPARRPERRPAKTGHRNPAAAAARPRTTSHGWRRSLEKASVGPLFVLNRLPRLLVPLILGALLLAGLALPSPWAALLMLPVAAFLLWLLALAWPVLSVSGRVVRILAVAVVVVAAVLRVAGKF